MLDDSTETDPQPDAPRVVPRADPSRRVQSIDRGKPEWPILERLVKPM